MIFLCARGVRESLRPPTPLFVLHFLCQYAPKLRAALSVIQAAPYGRLSDQPAFLPLAEAAEADADVLFSILHTPREWVAACGLPLAERLGGYALRTTHKPQAFASAMTRLADQNLADADPERWVEVLLHSHPAIRRRVAMAHEFARR